MGNLDATISFLKESNIKHLGIGHNLKEANQEIVLYEDDIEIVIVNIGWEVIQCEVTTGNQRGVNPLAKDYVLATISHLIKKICKWKGYSFHALVL